MGRGNDPIRAVKNGRRGAAPGKKDRPVKEKPARSGGFAQGMMMAVLCLAAVACVAGIIGLTRSVSGSLRANADQALLDTSDTVSQRYALMTMMMTAKAVSGNDQGQDDTGQPPVTDDGWMVIPPSGTVLPGTDENQNGNGDVPVTPANPDPPAQGAQTVECPEWADRVDGSDYVYLIKRGDTLSGISGTVGYYVDQLAKYNDIANVNLIYAGASLRVPVENYKGL